MSSDTVRRLKIIDSTWNIGVPSSQASHHGNHKVMQLNRGKITQCDLLHLHSEPRQFDIHNLHVLSFVDGKAHQAGYAFLWEYWCISQRWQLSSWLFEASRLLNCLLLNRPGHFSSFIPFKLKNKTNYFKNVYCMQIDKPLSLFFSSQKKNNKQQWSIKDALDTVIRCSGTFLWHILFTHIINKSVISIMHLFMCW